MALDDWSEQTRRSLPDRSLRILLAEDDDAMRAMLASALRADGYAVTECRDGAELRERLGLNPQMDSEDGYELVLSDIHMPLLNALQVFEGLFPSHTLPLIVIITAFGDAQTLERAEQIGSAATFCKPFEIDDLLETIHKLIGVAGTRELEPEGSERGITPATGGRRE